MDNDTLNTLNGLLSKEDNAAYEEAMQKAVTRYGITEKNRHPAAEVRAIGRAILDHEQEIGYLKDGSTSQGTEIASLKDRVSGHDSEIANFIYDNKVQNDAITSIMGMTTDNRDRLDSVVSRTAAVESAVGWVLDLGESDNSSNSNMPDKAPSRAADPAIAGNKNIRRILFTATDGEKTYGAYIEQVVYEKACVQMMFINGRRFDRFIDFTDYNRTEINTATSVGGIQPWQRTDPSNLSYNASTRRLTLANMWEQSIGSDVQLPLSTDSADGLMPAGTAKAINAAVKDASNAASEAQKGAADALDKIAKLIPSSLAIDAPKRINLGMKPVAIKAVLLPDTSMRNLIYLSDNKAVEVSTDGIITPVAKGTSRVNVIPTLNTALAQTFIIEVEEPLRIRLLSPSSMRFNQSGSLRLI